MAWSPTAWRRPANKNKAVPVHEWHAGKTVPTGNTRWVTITNVQQLTSLLVVWNRTLETGFRGGGGTTPEHEHAEG